MSSGTYRTMQLKHVNRVAVLNYIRRHRHTTKANLASISGLTFMAIKKILEELEELGLVRQDDLHVGKIGRKAVTYTIAKDYGYTAGMHINMFKTRVAIMNLQGEIVAIKGIDMDDAPTEPAQMIDLLVETLEAAIAESGIRREKLLGLGIGTPGPVNLQEGMVLSPPNMTVFRYFPLQKVMQDRVGIPVLIHKDTNAIAMGEYWRGAGAGYQNMAYVDADMGIGSGLILDGVLQPGAHFVAGEFGHITLDVNGPLCNCGSRGCLEAMSSGIAILRTVREEIAGHPSHPLHKHLDSLTIQQVLRAGNDGDSLVIPVLNNAAYNMGLAVGNLINIFDPEIIILGGLLVINYKPYFDILKDTALLKRLPGARENLIVPTVCKDRAGVIGAGELVSNHFFSNTISELLSKG
ncbi:ROK family protein [Ruminococcaceae bacterium OttesenSCG-928-D13]|nr:ROK family protein [Ruminococcaceae bacterium OttesenSCG-928-D13]